MTDKTVKNAILREKAHMEKAYYVSLKGGKCECCGYTFRTLASAEFHHMDSTTKVNNLSQMFGRYSKDKVATEVAKCIMLCSNCHNELHDVLGEQVTTEQTLEFIANWE